MRAGMKQATKVTAISKMGTAINVNGSKAVMPNRRDWMNRTSRSAKAGMATRPPVRSIRRTADQHRRRVAIEGTAGLVADR